MTTVSWIQIDTNNNGYVDGNEAVEAKQSGIQNVWNYMTEADFNYGVTEEQKLNIVREYITPSGILTSCTAVPSQDVLNRLNNIPNKKERLLQLYNEYMQYKDQTSEELKILDEQINHFDYCKTSCSLKFKNLCNTFGTNFDVKSDTDTLNNMKALMNRKDEINKKLSQYYREMVALDYVIKYQ